MSALKKSLQTLGAITAIGGLVATAPVPAFAQANPCAPKARRGCKPCAPKAQKSGNPCAPAAKKAKNNPGAQSVIMVPGPAIDWIAAPGRRDLEAEA
jgi:hypothetical protein